MKRKSYQCDECGDDLDGGLTLKEFGKVPSGTATVDGRLHFCGIECVSEWSKRAGGVLAPDLERHAANLHPRGQLSSPKLKGLVVN